MKACACFLLFIIVQVVGAAVALLLANSQRLFSGGSINDNALALNPQWYGVGIFAADLVAVLILWATMLIRRSPLPHRSQPMPWRWAVPLLAFLLLSLGLNLSTEPLNLDDAGVEKIFEGMRGSIVSILALTVIGPIVEELFFREGIQRHLRSAGLSPAWAIGISAALFGVAHGNVAQGVMAVLLGIVLGLLYEKTGDIRLSAPAHILNNTFGVALLYFPGAEDSIGKIPVVPLVCGGMLLILTAVYILVKWWDASLTKESPTPCE